MVTSWSLRQTRRSSVSPWTSSSISRCAAKPTISRKTSASAPFSNMLRSAIISSVIPDRGPGRSPSVGDCCGDQTLPEPASKPWSGSRATVGPSRTVFRPLRTNSASTIGLAGHARLCNAGHYPPSPEPPATPKNTAMGTADGSPDGHLIRWSMPEIRRIATRMALRQIQPASTIAWSIWRRAHQAIARRAHLKRNM